jgi:hypothetical protein
MTRLQTLENRLARIQNNKEAYILSVKIDGKLYNNPKSARYSITCVKIKREIRQINSI